jgi:hypothetical protein
MECISGSWVALTCEPGACDEPTARECPVETAAAIGLPCAGESRVCGNPCCSTAITCTAGRWAPGPDADCLCRRDDEFVCGGGVCSGAQACLSRCGPDDGTEHVCVELDPSCGDCSCAGVPGTTCETIGGRVYLDAGTTCG